MQDLRNSRALYQGNPIRSKIDGSECDLIIYTGRVIANAVFLGHDPQKIKSRYPSPLVSNILCFLLNARLLSWFSPAVLTRFVIVHNKHRRQDRRHKIRQCIHLCDNLRLQEQPPVFPETSNICTMVYPPSVLNVMVVELTKGFGSLRISLSPKYIAGWQLYRLMFQSAAGTDNSYTTSY